MLRFLLSLAPLALLLHPPVALSGPSGGLHGLVDARAAAACVAQRPDGTISTRFTLTPGQPADGSTAVAGRALARFDGDSVYLVAQLAAPARLAGTALLVRGRRENQAVFLRRAHSDRPQRLAGNALDTPLPGSPVSYRDLLQLVEVVYRPWLGANAAAAFEARAEAWPLSGLPTRHPAIHTWVEPHSCLPTRAVLRLPGKDSLAVALDRSGVRRAADGWRMDGVRLSDPASGWTTTLDLEAFVIDPPVPASRFTPRGFHRGWGL